MAKVMMMLFLLLLTFGRVGATSPNTGPLPEFCVKLEFSDKSVTGVEPSSWELLVAQEDVTIIDGDVIIKLFDFVFKDNEEIIGFSWEIQNAGVKDFTVKHGTTVLSYGTEFITTDRKGVSNAVWCLEELEEPPVDEPDDDPEVEDPEEEDPDIDEPPVDEPDDEEPDVEEPPVEDHDDEEPEVEEPPVEEPEEEEEPEDEEPEVEEPEEEEPPVDEEPEVEEPEVEEPEEEEPIVDEEPEFEDDDEPLPQTSDASMTTVASLLLLTGVMFSFKAKNK